jgi:IS30 family transposase
MEKRVKQKVVIRKWKGKEIIIIQETEHYALVTFVGKESLFSVKIDEIEN